MTQQDIMILASVVNSRSLKGIWDAIPENIKRVSGQVRYIVSISSTRETGGKHHAKVLVVENEIEACTGTALALALEANDRCDYCVVVRQMPVAGSEPQLVYANYWDACFPAIGKAMHNNELRGRHFLADVTHQLLERSGLLRHKRFEEK